MLRKHVLLSPLLLSGCVACVVEHPIEELMVVEKNVPMTSTAGCRIQDLGAGLSRYTCPYGREWGFFTVALIVPVFIPYYPFQNKNTYDVKDGNVLQKKQTSVKSVGGYCGFLRASSDTLGIGCEVYHRDGSLSKYD